MGYAARAIEAFEMATGLRVTIHDLDHVLWNELGEERFRHSHARCLSVKTGPFGSECRAFEIDELRSQLDSIPDGRIHRCHAGIIEAVAPVYESGRLRFVLFAGPMEADRSLHIAVDRFKRTRRQVYQTRGLPYAQFTTAARASQIRELLLQLAARLRYLSPLPAAPLPPTTSRKALILHFLGARFAGPVSLADLASHLNLSADRARHVVAQLFGKPFRSLLREVRIDAAKALLLSSSLQIGEIAERCGFENHSSFARAFRDQCGLAPRPWRLQNQG